MDPLSITTSCLALIGVVAKTSIAITAFIRECREARGDLTSVNRELSDLKIVLELLQEDTAGQDGELLLSESLQTQILSIIKNCGDVSSKVEQVLTDLRGSRVGAIRWVLDGKKEVASLKQSLEAHRSALSLALEMVNMQEDTGVIREDVGEIKQDTAQILEEIERLKERLPKSDRDFVIQGYLDSLTSYAATVCDTLDDERSASGDEGNGIEDGFDHMSNPVISEVKPSIHSRLPPAMGEKHVAPVDSTIPGHPIDNSKPIALQALAESSRDKSLQEKMRALEEEMHPQKELQVLVDSVSHNSVIPTDTLPTEADEENKGIASISILQPEAEDVPVLKHTGHDIDEESAGLSRAYGEYCGHGGGPDYDVSRDTDKDHENYEVEEDLDHDKNPDDQNEDCGDDNEPDYDPYQDFNEERYEDFNKERYNFNRDVNEMRDTGELKTITNGTNNVVTMGLSQDGLFALDLASKESSNIFTASDEFLSASHAFNSEKWQGDGSSTAMSRFLPAAAKLPLLVWANGFGLSWGLMFGDLLRELASHGYIVIANGTPTGLGMTDERGQLQAIRWATQTLLNIDDAVNDIRSHIDGTRIALAGQSKGAIHTYIAASTLRDNQAVKSIGIFNSGLMRRRAQDLALVSGLASSVYYFVGDERDVLFKNAGRDWKLVPKGVPAYFASLPTGHLGTMYEEAGGLFAVAAVKWLDYELKGDESSKRELLQPEGEWQVQSQNL
ncbi:hypothetical protein E8E14_012875 [Neopestalotiopsis sp. 37M]|nr:hypothetical protein E8E14_012875 [Neopestalotiopsis sp. 37M]